MSEQFPEPAGQTEADPPRGAAERLQTWIEEHPCDGYLRNQAFSILTDRRALRVFEERFPGRPLTRDELTALPDTITELPEAP